ncbi:hypothetical protein F511_18922 [Dorcoceras hygrometricum]|uniref:Uncharacterized protein n=1 Tax=Dorcoceras hygrometricum TaxID=472368 RepID=A0A2Z7AWB9_9LAMI|nr:hypothetical protein F511_18922 [Dorcoceras hygrometricum]
MDVATDCPAARDLFVIVAAAVVGREFGCNSLKSVHCVFGQIRAGCDLLRSLWELRDPGFAAGRGFNPAGGAPGGG